MSRQPKRWRETKAGRALIRTPERERIFWVEGTLGAVERELVSRLALVRRPFKANQTREGLASPANRFSDHGRSRRWTTSEGSKGFRAREGTEGFRRSPVVVLSEPWPAPVSDK